MKRNTSGIPTTAATSPRGEFKPLTTEIINELSVNDIIEVRGKTQINGFVPVYKAIITSVGEESIIVNYDLQNPFSELLLTPLRIDEGAQIRYVGPARQELSATAAPAITVNRPMISAFKLQSAASENVGTLNAYQIQELMEQDIQYMEEISTALQTGAPEEEIERLNRLHYNLKSIILKPEHQKIILDVDLFDQEISNQWQDMNLARRPYAETKTTRAKRLNKG
jgi:predicted DNA-binding protein